MTYFEYVEAIRGGNDIVVAVNKHSHSVLTKSGVTRVLVRNVWFNAASNQPEGEMLALATETSGWTYVEAMQACGCAVWTDDSQKQ